MVEEKFAVQGDLGTLCSTLEPFQTKGKQTNKQTHTHLEKLRIWNSRALGLTRLHCLAPHRVVSCAHRPGPGVGACACAVMGRVHKARWWKHGHQFLSRCSCFLLKRALGPLSAWQLRGRPAHTMAVRRWQPPVPATPAGRRDLASKGSGDRGHRVPGPS